MPVTSIDRLEARILTLARLYHTEQPARLVDVAPILPVLSGILDEMRALRSEIGAKR